MARVIKLHFKFNADRFKKIMKKAINDAFRESMEVTTDDGKQVAPAVKTARANHSTRVESGN